MPCWVIKTIDTSNYNFVGIKRNKTNFTLQIGWIERLYWLPLEFPYSFNIDTLWNCLVLDDRKSGKSGLGAVAEF